MAIEKLNHVAAEVSRVNEDNVTLRAQAHGAVKQVPAFFSFFFFLGGAEL